MKKSNISNMVKGWFIGPFEPSLYKTDDFECAVKCYRSGDSEAAHVHKIATEFTVIVKGVVVMNDKEFSDGDIIEIPPGESTDFYAKTDVISFVVKVPGAIGDKYEC